MSFIKVIMLPLEELTLLSRAFRSTLPIFPARLPIKSLPPPNPLSPATYMAAREDGIQNFVLLEDEAAIERVSFVRAEKAGQRIAMNLGDMPSLEFNMIGGQGEVPFVRGDIGCHASYFHEREWHPQPESIVRLDAALKRYIRRHYHKLSYRKRVVWMSDACRHAMEDGRLVFPWLQSEKYEFAARRKTR